MFTLSKLVLFSPPSSRGIDSLPWEPPPLVIEDVWRTNGELTPISDSGLVAVDTGSRLTLLRLKGLLRVCSSETASRELC